MNFRKLNCFIKYPIVFFVFTICYLPSPISYLHSAGTSAGNFLLRSPSAKNIGLSDAVTSIDVDYGGITALHYNPASTAFFENPQISLMGQRSFTDDNYGSVFFGIPTQYGSFCWNAVYYSAGDIELIDTLERSRTVKAEEDIVAGMNYSKSFLENFGMGLNVKAINSKLVDSFSASAVAMDIGAQLKLMAKSLSLGIAVQNLGTKLKYIDQEDSLPLTIRAGISNHFSLGLANKGLLSVDLVKVNEENMKEFIGVDSIWNEIFVLRGGYKIGQDIGKFSIGIGFLMGKSELDYAYTNDGDVGNTHSVSLSYKFAGADSDVPKSFKKPIPQSTKKLLSNDDNKKIVAVVLNLKSDGIDESSSLYITEQLRNALVEKGKIFDVVGKEKMENEIKKIYRFPIRCNEVDCALSIARNLDAKKVIMGSIGQFGSSFILRVRMIDTQTSHIEYGDSVRASSLADLQKEIGQLVDRMIYSLK
jgi:hypothetical protein